jgi:hypothetical protein
MSILARSSVLPQSAWENYATTARKHLRHGSTCRTWHSRAVMLMCTPVLLCMCLWMGYRSVVMASHAMAPGPIYTLTTLRVQLERDPQTWINTSVRVLGLLASCNNVTLRPGSSPCPVWHTVLRDPLAARSSLEVPVLLGSTPPMLSLLRRVPLLGELTPAPQVLQWGTPAVYAIQLRATPCPLPGSRTCFAALLLDPGPWQESTAARQYRGAGRMGLAASP